MGNIVNRMSYAQNKLISAPVSIAQPGTPGEDNLGLESSKALAAGQCVLECSSAAIVLDAPHRKTHCGYCARRASSTVTASSTAAATATSTVTDTDTVTASTVTDTDTAAAATTVTGSTATTSTDTSTTAGTTRTNTTDPSSCKCGMTICGECAKTCLEYHSSSGECDMMRTLQKIDPHFPALLLLTMRLVWRMWYEKKYPKQMRESPLPTIDWMLLKCIYTSTPTLTPKDNPFSKLEEKVKTTFQELTGGKDCEWLIQSEWDDILGRILGCAHAITDISLPLGEQSLGRALFLKHSFYNHACAPNAFLSMQPGGATVMAQVRMLRPLQPKEAVTISYIPTSGLDKQERQAKLLAGYHFTCACATCAGDTYEEFVKVPEGADVNVLREVQFTCNETLVQLQQAGATTSTTTSTTATTPEIEELLENCIATLEMSMKGIANQNIPGSHEIVIESHRLLAKAYSLQQHKSAEAIQEHLAFFQAVQPIDYIFDPVAKATQRLALAKDYKTFQKQDDYLAQLKLALEGGTIALGAEHAFVKAIAEELGRTGTGTGDDEHASVKAVAEELGGTGTGTGDDEHASVKAAVAEELGGTGTGTGDDEHASVKAAVAEELGSTGTGTGDDEAPPSKKQKVEESS
jgi:hypothetical protein